MELLTEGEEEIKSEAPKWQKSQPWTKTSGNCEEKSIPAGEGKSFYARARIERHVTSVGWWKLSLERRRVNNWDRLSSFQHVWRNTPEKFLDTNIVVRIAPWKEAREISERGCVTYRDTMCGRASAVLTLSFLLALNLRRHSTVSWRCIMEATVERCCWRETERRLGNCERWSYN